MIQKLQAFALQDLQASLMVALVCSRSVNDNEVTYIELKNRTKV